MTTLPYAPSLANATGTRVDSACKHHQQCRVSTDNLLEMIEPKNEIREINRNKYRYCVHKDELALGVATPWKPNESRKRSNNAYPRVVSNLGMIDIENPKFRDCAKMIKYLYHYALSIRDKEDIIKWFGRKGDTAESFKDHPNNYFPRIKPDQENPLAHFLPIMCDFTAMGYAQTLGWASSDSGDTMTTVMVGGMRTVKNGDFEVRTGDLIMWYWPFERDCFEQDGSRKPIIYSCIREWKEENGKMVYEVSHINMDPAISQEHMPAWNLTKPEEIRKEMSERTYGARPNEPKIVAKIKPYRKDYENPRLYDHLRVFAVAMSAARPYDDVDIKISRQSL